MKYNCLDELLSLLLTIGVIGDCKVMVSKCIAKQHRMVVCKMALMVKKKKAKNVKPKIRW